MSTNNPDQPSVYQFAINNVKARIRGDENKSKAEQGTGALTAFAAADILATAFMKPYGEVVSDLIRV